MLTLFIFAACANENQIIDTNPPSNIGTDAIEDECNNEQPVINLSCPEPVINLSCPEPVINVQVEAPEVLVDVEAPEVLVDVEAPVVNVAAPSVTINNDFSDLVAAIEDLANNIAAPAGSEVWAHIGYVSQPSAIWTNTSSQTAVITTAAVQSGCDVFDSNGYQELDDFCNAARCSTEVWSPGTQGVLQIPVEPGGWVDCTNNYGYSYAVYLGGYYQ